MHAAVETPAEYPLQLSAATSAYLWGNFLSPSTVDVWLGTIMRLPSAARVGKGFVACSVERVSVQVILF
jgi:hypothetical protein